MLLAHVTHVVSLVDDNSEVVLTKNSPFEGLSSSRHIPRASVLLFLPRVGVALIHIFKHGLF